ncbi:MAG: hypothetical protein WBW33_00870, partial [Bryobacteraceae bacterium]
MPALLYRIRKQSALRSVFPGLVPSLDPITAAQWDQTRLRLAVGHRSGTLEILRCPDITCATVEPV